MGQGLLGANNASIDIEEINLGDMVVPFDTKALDNKSVALDNKSLSSNKSKRSNNINANLQSFQLGGSIGGVGVNEVYVLHHNPDEATPSIRKINMSQRSGNSASGQNNHLV